MVGCGLHYELSGLHSERLHVVHGLHVPDIVLLYLLFPSPQVKNFAVIYLVDITEVPDFNKMYELYDPCTVMFFFRYTVILEYNQLNVF